MRKGFKALGSEGSESVTMMKKGPVKTPKNEGDTGSVTNQVRGTVSFGRTRVSGNDPKRNSMVSGNTGYKGKRGY